MNLHGRIRQMEIIYDKDIKPQMMQSAIAQVFRDMGDQKISVKDGLNEIQRIKKEGMA